MNYQVLVRQAQFRGRDHMRKNHHFSTEPAPALEVPAKVQNVEDFVPEDGLDRSFLEDTTLPKDKNKIGAKVAGK